MIPKIAMSYVATQMLVMLLITFLLPIFESVEKLGISHFQEIAIAVLKSAELVGLYFMFDSTKAGKESQNKSWGIPLTVATAWGGAELFISNIMYFIWGNETDTKWMYVQEALKLNASILEIVCVWVFVYSFVKYKSSSKQPVSFPIGSYIVVLFFRYLWPILVKVFAAYILTTLKMQQDISGWIGIALRFVTAGLFYLIAKCL